MYNKRPPKEIKEMIVLLVIAIREVNEWANRLKVWPQIRER